MIENDPDKILKVLTGIYSVYTKQNKKEIIRNVMLCLPENTNIFQD